MKPATILFCRDEVRLFVCAREKNANCAAMSIEIEALAALLFLCGVAASNLMHFFFVLVCLGTSLVTRLWVVCFLWALSMDMGRTFD